MLDSSQLGHLARDHASRDPERRRRAEVFLARLDASGWALFLCYHHLHELFSHSDDRTIAARFDILTALPMVAAVRSLTVPSVLGSVVDIHAMEVKVAFSDATIAPVCIRDAVAEHIVRLDSGANIVRPFVQDWPAIRAALQEQNARTREIVAISRSNFAGMEDVRVMDMLNGALRRPEGRQRRLEELHTNLSRAMRTRGDKRIISPEHSAAEFLQGMVRLVEQPATAMEFGLALLEAAGIDPVEIRPETTFRDVGRLAVFRAKLERLNRILGLPWLPLKSVVTGERLPSSIIQAAIEQFRPDTAEWKGSDLGDTHLACLALYADVTCVDKRTHEALRIARRKFPLVASVLRQIQKAGEYATLPDLIGVPA